MATQKPAGSKSFFGYFFFKKSNCFLNLFSRMKPCMRPHPNRVFPPRGCTHIAGKGRRLLREGALERAGVVLQGRLGAAEPFGGEPRDGGIFRRRRNFAGADRVPQHAQRDAKPGGGFGKAEGGRFGHVGGFHVIRRRLALRARDGNNAPVFWEKAKHHRSF